MPDPTQISPANDDSPAGEQGRGLFAAVIAMGVIFILLFFTLGFAIIYRMMGSSERPQGDLAVVLPEGQRMGDVFALNGQLAVPAALEDGRFRLYLVDPDSGRVTGSLTFPE